MSIVLVFCMLGIILFMFFNTKSYIELLGDKIKSQQKDIRQRDNTINDMKRQFRFILKTERERVEYRNNQISRLESELKFYKKLSFTNKNGQTGINPDKDKIIIDEAIKKAMLYSHPDKGLCKDANDFIKFRELYNSRKRA